MKLKNIQILLSKEKLPSFIKEIYADYYYDHYNDKHIKFYFIYDKKDIELFYDRSELIKDINTFENKIQSEYLQYTKYFIYTQFISRDLFIEKYTFKDSAPVYPEGYWEKLFTNKSL